MPNGDSVENETLELSKLCTSQKYTHHLFVV